MSQVQKLLIGIEASESISNWQGASLYFNLSGSDIGQSDKALFFAAIRDSTCLYHGSELFLRNGLPINELHLEDHINGNERRQNLIRSRYENNFLTFVDADVPKVKSIPTATRLQEWFHQNGIPEEEIHEIIDKVDGQTKGSYYWLEINFSNPVGINHVVDRLNIRLNVFPVINRRLNGNEKGGHHYLRDNSIKWVPLKPQEDFLSIRSVFEEKPPDYPQFLFKPFADFKEERIPSYTLRFGGVGRWDEYNAWERLAYIVRVLSENNRQEEIIAAAANSLSLEEIHQLLGKKISKHATDEKTYQRYLCIAP